MKELLCPICNKPLTLKKQEPYKDFYSCCQHNCQALTVIITHTTKEWY